MKITPENIETCLREIVTDPAVSDWVREAISELLQHDPVDAFYEANLVARLMCARMDKMLGKTK